MCLEKAKLPAKYITQLIHVHLRVCSAGSLCHPNTNFLMLNLKIFVYLHLSL